MSQSENQEIQSILNARQAQLEKLQYLMDSLSMELQQMSSLLENTDWPFLAPLAVTAGSEQNHAVGHSFNITSTPPASIKNAPTRRRLQRRLDTARRTYAWAKNCSTREIFAAAAA